MPVASRSPSAPRYSTIPAKQTFLYITVKGKLKVQVRPRFDPQGPVHSLLDPAGPTKLGPLSLRTQVREGQDRTPDGLMELEVSSVVQHG
jgi:hypothetical protein